MFKVSHKRIYTTITNYHILDKDLSMQAKGLMTWFLSDINNWDGSFDGILKNNNLLDKEFLLNIIDELKSRGYIEIDKKGNYKINEKSKKLADEDLKKVKASDTEELGNNSPKKVNLYTKCRNYINEYTEDRELRSVLIQYLNLRFNPGAGTRLHSMPIAYLNQWRNLLITLDTMEGDKTKIVAQSINKQWAKFVDIPKARDDVKSNSYTKEDIEKFRKRAKEIEKQGGQGIF